MNHPHEYTEEQEIYLRDMCLTRASYRDIMVAFNQKFGTALTRNGILGKCTRMGLRANKPSSKFVGKPQVRVAKRKHPISVTRIAHLKSSAPASPDETVLRSEGDRGEGNRTAPLAYSGVDAVFDSTPSTQKAFSELRRGECRWPANTDCSMACGARITIGSYCTAHAQIAYRTMPTIGRNRKVLAGAGYVDTRRSGENDSEIERGIEQGIQAPMLIPSFLESKETTQ